MLIPAWRKRERTANGSHPTQRPLMIGLQGPFVS